VRPRSSDRATVRQRPTSRPQPRGSALDAGLRLLGRRAHSGAELRRKLTRRGYDPEGVEAALIRLTEIGYVDDLAFAQGHVRRRSSGLGPLALSAELAARGVDRRVSAEAVAGLDGEAQLFAARRLAERMCGGKRWPGYRQLLDSVGPKLLRRGFSPGVVRAACRAVWIGTAGDPEN
jgi:regulatory protein